MDWWPITSSLASDQIEWSPRGGVVRAKARQESENNWRYRSCDKAKWAESIGSNLIHQKGGEKCLMVLPGEKSKKG